MTEVSAEWAEKALGLVADADIVRHEGYYGGDDARATLSALKPAIAAALHAAEERGRGQQNAACMGPCDNNDCRDWACQQYRAEKAEAERDAALAQLRGIGYTPYLDRMKELQERAESANQAGYERGRREDLVAIREIVDAWDKHGNATRALETIRRVLADAIAARSGEDVPRG